MKVIDISSKSLNKLPLLQLSNKIVNTEGKLYVYKHKDKWTHLTELLKIYYNQIDSYMVNKLYVLSELMANREILEMPELILPSSLVSVNGELSGFSMPFIQDNVNLSLFLNNENVNLEQKIKYLKEIYKILDKVLNIKELEGKFFLGDIHESNFILDLDSQKVKAIDLDSSYINGSRIPISKYLSTNFELDKLNNKYQEKDGEIVPSKNTTILCFIYMLINTLSNNSRSYRWDIEGYYAYLSYLNNLNISKDLLNVLENVYVNNNSNEFDIELLDTIDTSKDYSLRRMKR